MAGNSSTYKLRQSLNQNNIKRWENWSMSINYVVEQFDDVIKSLSDRLDLAETTIDALNYKIDELNKQIHDISTELPEMEYVKLQYSSIQINSAASNAYAKSCGVFSNVNSGKLNKVYIYSDKSLNGFFVNDIQADAKINESDTNKYKPFASISGSDSGTIISIKTNNATKIGNKEVNLYFSLDSSLETFIDSSRTANLKVKLAYSKVVQKPLVTIDKSALSKTIIEKQPVVNEKLTVEKYSTPIGQYSTTKTAAVIANKFNKNTKKF